MTEPRAERDEASVSPSIQDGTKEHPILVWQSGYSCGHAVVSPQSKELGKYYRLGGFLDFSGPCPSCQAKRKYARKEKAAAPTSAALGERSEGGD